MAIYKKIVNRMLVTTALEDTWPLNNEPVAFLGEWCRLYGRKKSWEKYNAIVLPYHWDDRKKLHNDFIYLKTLNEELLLDLSEKLNALHNVNYSLRYWRILVGPWLAIFSQIVFDRWQMIQYALHKTNLSGAHVLYYKKNQFVPNDMIEFNSLFLKDSWNEFIYASILDWMKFPVDRINVQYKKYNACKNNYSVNLTGKIKNKITQTLDFLSGVFCRDSDYFLYSSFLTKKDEAYLQIKLGQIPSFWEYVPSPKLQFNLNSRQWTLLSSNNSVEFSSFLRTLIPKHIPTNYLEGYESLVSLTGKLPWPKKPKAIFTATGFFHDDIFKAWLAKKTEEGVPFISAQHGGQYGIGSWFFWEDHQITISDYFLTWGWSQQGQSKIIPIGNLKGYSQSYTLKKTGSAILVGIAMPRQSYAMLSGIVSAKQWQEYFNDQCRFISALPFNLRNQVIVRLYPNDYEHSQKERWRSFFPDIQLDEGKQSLKMKKIRLYIATYNATTFLESMALNCPTIIFWNPKHWEIRDSAISYFKNLKSVGIFHETPESAAKQMVIVLGNIEGWWNSEEVQSARMNFCKRYAYIPEKPLEKLEKIFRKITDTP